MKSLLSILALTVAGGAVARSAPVPPAGAASAVTAAAAQPGTPQRSKMKACNAEAREKAVHGPDRRAFMKQCLSSKAAKAKAGAAS